MKTSSVVNWFLSKLLDFKDLHVLKVLEIQYCFQVWFQAFRMSVAQNSCLLCILICIGVNKKVRYWKFCNLYKLCNSGLNCGGQDVINPRTFRLGRQIREGTNWSLLVSSLLVCRFTNTWAIRPYEFSFQSSWCTVLVARNLQYRWTCNIEPEMFARMHMQSNR